MIIINYCITIDAYYNCVVHAHCNYCISNIGFLEDCDNEENVAVAGAAAVSCLERICKTLG
jgi:hypothetical protein